MSVARPSRPLHPAPPVQHAIAGRLGGNIAKAIDDAATRLAHLVGPTPIQRNARLSDRMQGDVWLKREDLQPVRSYKIRGAYNFIAQLDQASLNAGLVCASAGNHAQGVAYASVALGVKATIFVPRSVPPQKLDRIAALGRDQITIELAGDSYEDAQRAAQLRARATGAIDVPAFDHPHVIAGQGTAIREAVQQLGHPPDLVVVPVGGGGLLAGTVGWLQTYHPSVRVVGIEPAGARCMAAALQAGHPVDLSDLDPFVDGAAVRRAGTKTFAMIRRANTEVLSVHENRVCSEILDLYQTDAIIAEPAGALAPAALGITVTAPRRTTTICLLSGGNNDPTRFPEIIRRSREHQQEPDPISGPSDIDTKRKPDQLFRLTVCDGLNGVNRIVGLLRHRGTGASSITARITTDPDTWVVEHTFTSETRETATLHRQLQRLPCVVLADWPRSELP